MTNEELALAIKEGDDTLITQLWEQTNRLLFLLVNRYHRRMADRFAAAGVTMEDLEQECYFVLLDTVAAWTPESSHKLTTFMNYHALNRFNALAGFRTSKSRKEPLNRAGSLDEPLPGAEDFTIADTIPDPAAAGAFESAEEGIYIQQLRHDLDRAIDTLPEAEQDTICRRFWQGESLKQIGEREGVTATRIRQREWSALCKLRHPRHRKRLEQFFGERVKYHCHVGVNRFQTTGTSAVEELAMLRERMEREFSRLDGRNQWSESH